MPNSPYSRFLTLLLLSVVLILTCLSCTTRKQRIEEEYLIFSSVPIKIPLEMLCVHDGKIETEKTGDAPYKFVYYIDSTECSSCSISHLSAFNKIIDLSEQNEKFDLLIIFSSHVKNAKNIAEDINIYEYDFPVYVDNKAEFRNQNKHIPSNKMFHQFLLKEDNTPAFVGSPLANKQMSKLFDDTLISLGITKLIE